MKGYLCYSVVHFHFKSRKRQYVMRDNHLPHLDSMDDWWDYWFTTGKYTYQLCGDYENGKRLFRNLKIYVYPANSSLDDSERIAEINDVTISFQPIDEDCIIKRINNEVGTTRQKKEQEA